ncbi:EAL domain-containing protein [Chitinilyticum piscinae]|uniref:EAL domain-containing protein n=1 Tax=Chitinilyticum piscinae TaxID=2866724 RepID=A0A8J7G1H0_9NEIS|nr:EAL domain-containing protein [Chitinilyticum piscinae]MBE9609653.1 EAL domain-containing protein [Chitinilyticum piscinae]
MNNPTSLQVYIVDDSSVQREHAKRICTEAGLQLAGFAEDGLQALMALKQGEVAPNLLLLDLEMPGLNGLGLLQELIRLDMPLSVIVLSSREGPLLAAIEQLRGSSRVRILASLQKPLSLEKLTLALHEADMHSQPDSPAPELSESELRTLFTDTAVNLRYLPHVALGNGMVQGLLAEPFWHTGPQLIRASNIYPQIPASVSEQLLLDTLIRPALRHIQHLRSRGLKLTLRIPVPQRLLLQRLFPALLLNELHALDLPPTAVSLLVEEETHPLNVPLLMSISQLRLQNCNICIRGSLHGVGWLDQLGLGYAPFNEILLDPLFIQRATAREFTQILLEGLLLITRKLNIHSLAEGISDPLQWQTLLQLGCASGSGPLIGEWLDIEAVPGWIRSNSERLRACSQPAG